MSGCSRGLYSTSLDVGSILDLVKRLDPRAIAYPGTLGFLLAWLLLLLLVGGGFVTTFGIPFAHDVPDDLIAVTFYLLLAFAALVAVYALACLLAGAVRFVRSWRANGAA
jgi:hypothetical protein